MKQTSSPNVIALKPPEAQELKTRLLQNLTATLRFLLPNGVIRQCKFYVGNVQNHKGESLVVELNSQKAGLWHDFATDDGGDILDLWAEVKGVDKKTQFRQLLADIQSWLGATPLGTSSLGNNVHVTQPSHAQHSPHRNTQKLGQPTAKWDYTDAEGKLLVTVYRYDPPNSKKQFRPWDAVKGVMKSPEIRPIYNQVGIIDAETVVLVEGEKCAEALIKLGIPATTAMNGAKAPVDKTDWSPIKGKKIIIWPDNDEPGFSYVKKAASACAKAGAIHVETLEIPPDKPIKWDVADAVAEGLNIPEIIEKWPRVVAKEKPTKPNLIPLYSVAELEADNSPMPEDLISPRLLTPSGTLVFGGAPKVGKSDFLVSLLAHMAAGVPFLEFAPPRPLRVLYLQAEVQYHYLRERIKRLRLPPEVHAELHSNLIITPQISLTLNEVGIKNIVDSVKAKFADNPPDIIAIDPIRNVFDGGGIGGENDNDAMMFFLKTRVEELRNQLNPDAGVILVHHTRKLPKKQIEEDPFQAFSGASSLRSYYTAGMLMYYPSEDFPERKMVCELRNGPAISPKLVDKAGGKWININPDSERLVMREQGKKQDAERFRKKEVILRLIYEEAMQGRVYTTNQFAERFENKSGLGGNRSIRERISVLATKGYVKFFKNAKDYGLPLPMRTPQGYLCVEAMRLGHGGTAVYPTHFKHPQTGSICEVDAPEMWIYFEEDL